MNYRVDWERTVENINVLLQGRTYKKNFAELFGVEGRAVQRKISTAAKQELSISEFMMLADYFGCEILDLVIFEGEVYTPPSSDWKEGWREIEVEDKNPKEVTYTLETLKKIKEKYEIRDIYEFLLYLPLIEEENLRDVVVRIDGDLTYDRRAYIMKQLTWLYQSIPECEAKHDADKYRDNVLRVKGAPGNNPFGLQDAVYNKYYDANLRRYLEEGNSGLWSYEQKKEEIEKRRKECLGL